MFEYNGRFPYRLKMKKYIERPCRWEEDAESPEVRQNRLSFFAEHNVTKLVPDRRWRSVWYLLEMSSTWSGNRFFERGELFETSDGHYVGIMSPYDSDAQTYYDALEGWQTCPGMCNKNFPSFFKKVDVHKTADVVFERHMRKLVELNFEPVRDAFVTEQELDDWLDQGPHVFALL